MGSIADSHLDIPFSTPIPHPVKLLHCFCGRLASIGASTLAHTHTHGSPTCRVGNLYICNTPYRRFMTYSPTFVIDEVSRLIHTNQHLYLRNSEVLLPVSTPLVQSKSLSRSQSPSIEFIEHNLQVHAQRSSVSLACLHNWKRLHSMEDFPSSVIRTHSS
ncbi:hypothetical protein BDD12DRAFT_822269 [Trichophaea hybrida]|nr:hypothetical protein BDD12DRAFT_822269 [Trichophaea hybrida]